MRAVRRLASRTHQRLAVSVCASGSTYGEPSITTRDSSGCLILTVSSRPAGLHANTATARVPPSAMPGSSSTPRTASTSARNAIRSSWARPPSRPSTLCWASLSTEVIALARADGVANSEGSRFR
jgi:hypothetical protein